MSWKVFIDEMSKATSNEWRRAAMRMAWAFRKGVAFPPDDLQRWITAMPTREEWDAVRQQINKRRRNAYDRARYESKPERDAAIARRREYMRKYMRRYRGKPSANVEKSVSA